MLRTLPITVGAGLDAAKLSILPFFNPVRRLAPLSLRCDIQINTSAGEGASGAVAAGTVSQEDALVWVRKDRRRLLHIIYRVRDMEKMIKFYTKCLGMKLLRKQDIPEERYMNAFVGYKSEDSHFVVELTYNYGVKKYDIGNGFGHFGIAIEDVGPLMNIYHLVR